MFHPGEYSEEQAMIAAFASNLGKEYDEMYFLPITKKQQFPQDYWDALVTEGYLGIIADEQYGGVNLTNADLSVFVYAMAVNGLGSLRLIHQLVCADIMTRFANDEQKRTAVPAILAGQFWSYADLENTRGRSIFDIASTAEPSGEGYRINGGKCTVVGARESAHLILAARTQPFDPHNPSHGLSLFVIPGDADGISYSAPHLNVRLVNEREEMAATGDTIYNLSLRHVEVPASALIGELDQAGTMMTAAASRQLQLLALTNVGWGERILEKTIAYAKQRVIFQDPIASYQAVQHPLVLAKTKIEMAKLLAERCADVMEQDDAPDLVLTYASMAKYYATEAAYAACDIGLQAHGGAGYDRDTGIISLWPLILLSRTSTLSNHRILKRFAELTLGLPAGERNDAAPPPALQDIHFETRTAEEQDMLKAIREVATGGNSNAPVNLKKVVMEAMAGRLGPYRKHILAEAKGGMPQVKHNVMRMLNIRMDAPAVEGSGLPAQFLKTQPQKQGLSMMALAAIASGPGGPERVAKEFLPKMAEGKLFCYCITEPDAGTNTHKIKTTAEDMGDHYILNGSKTYITSADSAYFMCVVARIENDGEDQGVGTFVMEQATEGISMTPMDIAALGDSQFTVYFENVKLPKDALVGTKKATGDTGKGISHSVFATLNLERILIANMAMAAGLESLGKALKQAKTPSAFGDVPGESDRIQVKLADLRMQAEMCNLALKKATVAFDNNEDPRRIGMFVNMAKYLSSMFADDAGQVALELYGIDGLDRDKDDIGALCQIGRVLRTVPINNEMVLNFLGENLLDLPKSYRV